MIKKNKILLILILFISSLLSAQDKTGHLLIIGGGSRPDYMMKKIIDLAGGPYANIIVIPNASSEPIDVAEYQVNQLKELGAQNADYIFAKGDTLDADSTLAKLDGVTGIFFSGGDQSRLAADLLNTKFLERIKNIYKEGGVISGTSAGAAVMSEIMITGDEWINPDENDSFTTIMKGNVAHTPGFGFVTEAVIDQHFIYRKRHNRLISLVLENPDLLGIGIDESTAILVYPDRKFDVIGEYQVIVYDASEAENINTNEKKFFGAENIKMHVLNSGKKFDLIAKKVIHN